MPQHLSNKFRTHVPWPWTKLTWSIAISLLVRRMQGWEKSSTKYARTMHLCSRDWMISGKRVSNLEKSRLDDAHHGTSRDGAQTITPTPVGSTHSPSNAGHISALPPDTTGGVHNTTSVGSAHNANPVGDTHSHPVSKVNRASQTETQRGSNSLVKPSADATARSSSVKSPQKSQFQWKKSFKERVEITPSFISNQAPTPYTKVLLDRSGPPRTRQGVVSPATKPAGDQPQRLSSTKWWRPPSFSGTLEDSGQTEEILTSK